MIKSFQSLVKLFVYKSFNVNKRLQDFNMQQALVFYKPV
jgi:hypothetical protein